MKGVTTTLAQIQQRILQYIGPDTFLVGHSLENDLRVMKLVHLKNLDTAIMYPHARVRPHLVNSHHAYVDLYRADCHQTLRVEYVCCAHGTSGYSSSKLGCSFNIGSTPVSMDNFGACTNSLAVNIEAENFLWQ